MTGDRLRCNGCGRFLPWPDCVPMAGGSSTYVPLSDRSAETVLFHCAACTQLHGPPVAIQGAEVMR